MTIQFATNNEIILDGAATGHGVSQTADGTRVTKDGRDVAMRNSRYNLTTDKYLNDGVAGLSQFETDFRAAITA